MNMLPQTALIKYHCQAHQHTTEVTRLVGMIDPPLGIIATPDVPAVITRIGTGSVIPNPTHITMDIGVAAIMTPTRAAPDHSTDPHIITTHATEAQVHTATAVTHHTLDPHPVETFPEMTADLNHTNLTDNTTNQHEDLPQVCKQCLGKIRTENTNRLQLTTLPQNTIAQMIRIVTLRVI